MSAIQVSYQGPTDQLPAAVEAELAAFDQFFTAPLSDGGAGNDPLIPPEKALLRTYLVARLSGRMPSPPAETETSPA